MVDRRTVDIPEDQASARVRFGAAIRVWFRINRWSQEVPHQFAKQRGLNGPWNSQMSLLMSGKLDPKAQFWMSLESFNAAVHNHDLVGLDEGLCKRMDNRMPFTTEEGNLATAADFFGMFIGRVTWSKMFDNEPLLSEAEAEQKGAQLTRALEAVMLESMMNRRELWEKIKERLDGGHGTDDPSLVQRWMIGIEPYTPELHLAFGKNIEDALKELK